MGTAVFKLLSGLPCGITVVLRSEEKAWETGEKSYKKLERSLRRGAVTQEVFQHKKDHILFTHRLEDLSGVDLVIEAITEDLEVKIDLFRRLEAIINPQALLVTNTSSVSINKLAQTLRHPERFCGLHFFHPVQLINLIEIIRWSETPVELIEKLRTFIRSLNREAVVCYDAPGSVINAILTYYYVEAFYILEQGLVLPSKLDELARRFFYVGPCESVDVVGVDFFVSALKRAATPGSLCPIRWREDGLNEVAPEDVGGRVGFYVPALFWELLSSGRLGKQVSKGIYLYEKDKPKDDTPGFYYHPESTPPPPTILDIEEQVATRLLYSLFNGTIYVLQCKMGLLDELDVAMREVLLMKEGPFTMMAAMGKQRVRQEFDRLACEVSKRFMVTDFSFLP